MEIKTVRLILREVHPTDLQDVHDLHSIPVVDQYNTLGLPPNTQATMVLLDGWILAQTQQPRKQYVFILEDLDGSFVGLIGLNLGKVGYHSAELWYKLHPDHWKHGFATEAVEGILQFCFDELNLHRLEAGCATENTASVRVLEKAGFIREGVGRKKLPIRGTWVDNYRYAILEEDWLTLQAERK